MSSSVNLATDVELVEHVGAGDQLSLAELYQRYAGPLFDFSARIAGRDTAPDIVQATFVKAWTSLQKQSAPRHPRAWLYTIARNEAIDELRRSGRSQPTDFDDEFSALDLAADESAETSPEAALHDREIAELVWSAAAALNEESRSLLDAQLRHGLNNEEIANLLGVDMQNAYKKMSRLRSSLEEAVSDELLRRERGECDELDAITAGLGSGDLTPTARRAISKHVRSCDLCEERRRRMTSPAALFSRLSVLPFALPLMDATFDRVRVELPAATAAESSTSAGVFERLNDWWSRVPLGAKIVLVLVPAAIAAIITLLIVQADDVTIEDPNDAASVGHLVGVANADDMISIQWTPPADATAFSIEWNEQPVSLPDDVGDLPGGATGATSPALDDGEWYFHLRTQGGDGSWTSTLHLGPYVIKAAVSQPIVAPTTTSLAPTTTAVATTTVAPTTTAVTTTTVAPTTTPAAVIDGDCGDGMIAVDGAAPNVDPRLQLIGVQVIVVPPNNDLWLVACFAEPWVVAPPLELYSFAFNFAVGLDTGSSLITYELHAGVWTVLGDTDSGEFEPVFIRTENGNVLLYTGLAVAEGSETSNAIAYLTASTPSSEDEVERATGELAFTLSDAIVAALGDATRTTSVDTNVFWLFDADGVVDTSS